MRKSLLTVLAALVLGGLAPSLAQADPDTTIQKPGHISISRPLGDV
jgi:hypothetical protein